MPFPLRVGRTQVASGPELVLAVERDTADGEPPLVPGKNAVQWLLDLVESRALSEAELRGLTAALIQKGSAEAVCVGLRLATTVGSAEFGPLILHALAGLDVGTLLTLDPLDPNQAVEDALLRACVQLADLSDPALRNPLLGHLRHAGHNQAELELLARHATPDEIRIWLPAVLSEFLPPDWLALLHDASLRGDEVVAAVEDALRQLEPERRDQVLSQLGH